MCAILSVNPCGSGRVCNSIQLSNKHKITKRDIFLHLFSFSFPSMLCLAHVAAESNERPSQRKQLPSRVRYHYCGYAKLLLLYPVLTVSTHSLCFAFQPRSLPFCICSAMHPTAITLYEGVKTYGPRKHTHTHTHTNTHT